MIAEVWFKHLNSLSSELQEQIKVECNNKTLIGEYVGNNEYQHLVGYDEQTIIFYCVVDNESPVTCMLPEESAQIFKNFNLRCVKTESKGKFCTYEELKK